MNNLMDGLCYPLDVRLVHARDVDASAQKHVDVVFTAECLALLGAQRKEAEEAG